MRVANILRFTGAVVATVVFASTAHAQLFRAYLSPTGNDANNCTLPTPCRLLPAALTAVADGGEIWMLGSANYNTATVNIAKSVSILAVPGVVGSVVATGGPAISIATAGVKVLLRNLVITPLSGTGGTDGINVTNGTSLTVDNCLIANLSGSGILVDAVARVQVTDTKILDNVGVGIFFKNGANGTVARATVTGSSYGIAAQSTAAINTTVDIASSTISANLHGVNAYSAYASAVVRVSVRDSHIVQNTFGLTAECLVAAFATLSASNNIVSHGSYGIFASADGAKVWASGNTISDNTTYGFFNYQGVIESAGNNALRNNGTDVAGPVTIVAPQ